MSAGFMAAAMRGVGAVPALNLPDGLHPTATGHEILAENVERGLRDALRGLERE